MNLYEKIMILDPDLDEKTMEETVEKVKGLITRHGGEILKLEHWGKRKLAYELNKRQQGYYILLLFKSSPSTIGEIEKFCKVTDPVIKFMVVKLQKKRHIEAVMSSLTKEDTRVTQEEPVAEGAGTPGEEKGDV